MEHKTFHTEFGRCSDDAFFFCDDAFVLSSFKMLNHGKLLKNND